MSTAIVKYQPPRRFDRDAYAAAMFLMFARAPRKETPEIDGFFELGEIGDAPEKHWTRLTPYSIARKETHGYDKNPPYDAIIVRPGR